ncbi:tetratricopeptide repeat protein [Pusillimonas sp.]|uniref:tetratricopeptide repeat protein n=1 Tax=Pusillimonas sp. TaxID=3040095 RepID=UPI0037CB3922
MMTPTPCGSLDVLRHGRFVAGLFLAAALAGCAAPGPSTQVQPLTAFDNEAMQASDLRIADSALQGGDMDVALSIYHRLTQSHPTLIQAWTGLAAAHFLTGELEAAKMVYNEVLQRFPDQQLDARLGLARIALRHRRLPEAMAHYESILAQSPDHPLALAGLGVAYDLAGNAGQAQATYRRGLSAYPDHAALRANLGLSLALGGQPREAVNILLGVTGVSSQLPQGRNNLAFAYGLLGRDDAAESILMTEQARGTAQDNLEFYRYVRTRMNLQAAAAQTSEL